MQWTLDLPKGFHISKAQPFGHFTISKITCHSSSMAMALPNPPQGLASELWHGLQVKNLLGLINFSLFSSKPFFNCIGKPCKVDHSAMFSLVVRDLPTYIRLLCSP